MPATLPANVFWGSCMQITPLHRRVLMDAEILHSRVRRVFPARLPTERRGQSMNLQSWLDRLNNVTEELGIVNLIADAPEAVPGTVRFCAEWSPSGDDADIHISWIVHPRAHRLRPTPKLWRRWYFGFWMYTMHELVHRHQHNQRPHGHESRTFRPATEDATLREEQTYLGDYDEIEAHAHDIALEMLAWYPGMPFRIAMKSMRETARHFPYATYPIYSKAFASTPDHPALTVLHWKIRTWYNVMQHFLPTYKKMQLYPYPIGRIHEQ